MCTARCKLSLESIKKVLLRTSAFCSHQIAEQFRETCVYYFSIYFPPYCLQIRNTASETTDKHLKR